MRKTMKRLSAFLACIIIGLSSSMVVNAETGYTYNFDYWGDVQYSPDAYTVSQVLTGVDMGLDSKLSNPTGLYVQGNRVFICDTNNNRIIELERDDKGIFSLNRVIDSFEGDVEVNTFASPTDIAVSEDGYIFICDKNNNRIVKLDEDLNYQMSFVKPTDANFDQELSFLPDKLAIDTAGRVYCVATNVNKGLIKYEANGDFSRFVGATEVTYDFVDWVWKKIATEEQRAQMEAFVPTEYSNIYMDYEGFVFACTHNVSPADLDSGAADAVRRLNLMGTDILVRNGNWYVLGDIHWDEGGGYEGPSQIIDVTSMENDIYFLLDKNRGRIFAYDDQGNLVYAFGGSGNQDGYFRQPVAIEHMGHDLLVLDSLDCSITVFRPTEFGNLVYDAIEQFQSGKYTDSGDTWQEVIALNGNYDLAYIGVGRALLRQERYGEALDYFELKYDDDNYSKAFKQYRKEVVEENIFMVILVLALIVCVPMGIGRLKAIKHEIDTDEYFRK